MMLQTLRDEIEVLRDATKDEVLKGTEDMTKMAIIGDLIKVSDTDLPSIRTELGAVTIIVNDAIKNIKTIIKEVRADDSLD